jgi:hypothetical protein
VCRDDSPQGDRSGRDHRRRYEAKRNADEPDRAAEQHGGALADPRHDPSGREVTEHLAQPEQCDDHSRSGHRAAQLAGAQRYHRRGGTLPDPEHGGRQERQAGAAAGPP